MSIGPRSADLDAAHPGKQFGRCTQAPCLIGAEAFVQGISFLGAGNCLAGRSLELSSTIRMRIGG